MKEREGDVKIRIKPTQDEKKCMFVVSWGPEVGGLEIGEVVLRPATSGPPKSFLMFSGLAILFTSLEEARGQLQKMLDALKKHPKTSGSPVDIEWSSPSWRQTIMGMGTAPPS